MKTLSEVDAASARRVLAAMRSSERVVPSPSMIPAMVVSISSTELPLLTYVRSVIGAGRITGKVRSRDHHSPSFAYCITSRQALQLLAQVTPFLRTYKSARACMLLENYTRLTPRNGRYTASATGRAHGIRNPILRNFHPSGNHKACCSLAWDDEVRRHRAARAAHAND
jgi:hypothetical protein